MANKKIECVTYCNNYSDFLSETLPFNKHYFDNYIVATSLQDKKTIELCDLLNVHCIALDESKYEADEFRSHCLNKALNELKYNDWAVNLDADVWLPPRTRDLLEIKSLDEKFIYGMDRMMCNSYEEWRKFIKQPKIHEGWIYLHLNAFEMGVRNVAYTEDGYVPIGFFQLWNVRESGIKDYPIKHIDKKKWQERVDTIHAKRWKPEHRGFIPDIVAVHLESEQSEMGVNWDNGRKSPYFGIE